jgi:hypothetical protein
MKLNLSRDAQITVAVLSAIGAVGTTLVHDFGGLLPTGWAAAITSVLAVVAAVAGFIKGVEPSL